MRAVTGVRTACGAEVAVGAVVLACGQWTRQLAADAGVVVPTAIVPHQYVIFDKVEGVSNELPVTRDYCNKVYIKPEVGGLMVGTFECPHVDMPPQVAERNAGGRIPADAENELYDDSVDKASDSLESALELVPSLGKAGVKQFLHGPDCHSADHEPIMGRAPGTANLYVASGFNSQGIQTGPGVGRAMAEWVVHGDPSTGAFAGLDFSMCDVRRFHPPSVSCAEWGTARALEGCALSADRTRDLHEPHIAHPLPPAAAELNVPRSIRGARRREGVRAAPPARAMGGGAWRATLCPARAAAACGRALRLGRRCGVGAAAALCAGRGGR
jgi:hypothetical protein